MSEAGPEKLTNNSFRTGDETSRLISDHDWSTTNLGPVDQWHPNLLSSVSSCLQASLPTVVWWGEDRLKVFNQAFAKLFDISPTTALGLPATVGLPDVFAPVQHSLDKVMQTGIAVEYEQWQIVGAGDRAKQYQVIFTCSPIFSGAREIAGVYAVVVRNRKEHTLLQQMAESERRLRMVIDSSDLGTWDYNPLEDTLTLSDKSCSICDISPEQATNLKSFIQYVHPEDKLFVEEEINRALHGKGDVSFDVSYRIVRPDGAIRWVHSHGKTYFNDQLQAEHFVGTMADVTEDRERELKRNEHEIKMLLTIKASAMGSYEWDIVTSQFEYTERLAEIFGFPNQRNLKQSDFSSRIHLDDRAMRLKAHEEAFRTGSLFYEARIVWPDNSIHWVRANGEIIFNQDRRPIKMYGTVLDITQSKNVAEELEAKVRQRTKLLEQKNQELKLSEERYYKMTEEVEDYAIILLDKAGTILNWNKGAQKIKGYRDSEIVGSNLEVFYLEEDRATNLPQTLIGMAKSQGRAMHEGWRKRKDGTKFWGSIVITALHDQRDNVIGFTKVTRDLTERKLAEDMLKQHATELENKNKQLEQFAYIASHDLQEPLRKIQTFIHVLEKRIDNRESREKYFQKINAAAKRMAELIQSVLNYSRLTPSDDLYQVINLNEVLENVKVDYELLIAEKNATIVSTQLPSVRGIPLQISQLFSNLIGNALKFSRESPTVSIKADWILGRDLASEISELDAETKYIRITFIDNGIGFDQQYVEKIFTIFQRLNRREDYAGTGIGLALCKKIVDNHHGHIKAQGVPGKGATFTVYLPE